MIFPSLEIRKTVKRGRGVFTNGFIKADTVIEVSPVVVMEANERSLLDETLLRNYIFEWGEDCKQCAMALGYISLYNHSYASNCEYFMDFKEQIMFVKTVRDVAAGTELTLNYNGDWNDETVIWFEAE